ncbi:unnamed protein product [Owenia fusiformis]|uniref:Neuronal membrane glycoprotein M6-b n=1 Tax=Owenia fusiformis TaxID=6347 RepID=A0A8S4N649_OWEFU|nr:unnamed protein product [Owenia fusiformis]
MGDCLGRTPFASLIAGFIVLCGVGIFCGTVYRASQEILDGILLGLYNVNVTWLKTIQVIFIIVAVVMGCFAIFLFVFGCLATGATRENVYQGAKCIMGGRVSAGVFMLITYILNLIWMGVTSVMAMPIIIYIMVNSICVNEFQGQGDWFFESPWRGCVNMSRFGIYYEGIPNLTYNYTCGATNVGKFCQHVDTAGVMFSIAFAGSLLIVLGMVTFMLAISANFTRIKSGSEIKDYRQQIALSNDAISNTSGPF